MAGRITLLISFFFIFNCVQAQRTIGGTGELLYYRTSNDTLYFSTTKVEESGVVLFDGGTFFTDGATAIPVHFVLTGVDSVTLSAPSTITLSASSVTSSGSVNVGYSIATDTTGIDDIELTMTAHFDGVTEEKIILLRTFDNNWNASTLTYTPDLNITDTSDVTFIRDSIRSFLYPVGYPTTYYDSIAYDVATGIALDVNPEPENLLQVDAMYFDYHIWENIVYRIRPKVWNGKVAFVAAGHWATYENAGDTDKMADELLKRGYEVFFGLMPLDGSPSGHNAMEAEEGNVVNGKVFTAFVDHYVRTANWIEDSLGVSQFPITGISGGGWQTPIMMAMDTRFSEGISFAGSYPLGFTSSIPGSAPHYEQGNAADNFYADVASYEDLYVASTSNGRTLHLLHNREDNCCFGTKAWQLFKDTLEATVYNLPTHGKLNVTPYWPGPIHRIGDVGVDYSTLNFDSPDRISVSTDALAGDGPPILLPRKNGDHYFDYTSEVWYLAYDNDNGNGSGDGLDLDDWVGAVNPNAIESLVLAYNTRDSEILNASGNPVTINNEVVDSVTEINSGLGLKALGVPKWNSATIGNNISVGVFEYFIIYDSATVATNLQTIGNNNNYTIVFASSVSASIGGDIYWTNSTPLAQLRQETNTSTKVPFNVGFSLDDTSTKSVLGIGRTSNYRTSDDVLQDTTALDPDAYYIFTVEVIDDDVNFYINNQLSSSASFVTATGDCSVGTAPSDFFIGMANDGGTNRWFNDRFKAFYLFNDQLTAAERTAVNQYLNSIYQLY